LEKAKKTSPLLSSYQCRQLSPHAVDRFSCKAYAMFYGRIGGILNTAAARQLPYNAHHPHPTNPVCARKDIQAATALSPF
jgi:hypothetical protein